MQPFALETFALPEDLPDDFSEDLDQPLPKLVQRSPEPSLAQLHWQRLQHSCRLLNLKQPSTAMWQEFLQILRQRAQPKMIYSLRYYGKPQKKENEENKENKKNKSNCIHSAENWALWARENPYPPVSQSIRAALAPELRQDSHMSGLIWNAKSHWQVGLSQHLDTLKQQEPLYSNCEDILYFMPDAKEPLLQEGLKSNVFLLQWTKKSNSILLRTPRAWKKSGASSRLLCGTTRNWLCKSFATAGPPSGYTVRVNQEDITVQVSQEDLYLTDLQDANGLMLCNAAMGPRLVRELVILPDREQSSDLPNRERSSHPSERLQHFCGELAHKFWRSNAQMFQA